MNRSRKILPPVYFLIAIAMSAALHIVTPITVIMHPPVIYLGALVVATGVVVIVWPAAMFSEVGTPIKPFEESTHLVTGGPYRVTRNPMYLGMAIVLLGIGMLFGSISAFLPTPLFMWFIQRHFIRLEEAALESRFGDRYREYKNSVRRWL